MIPIFDLRGFPCATVPADLRPQLEAVIGHAADCELLDLTVVLVIEVGDTEPDVIHELDWSPLVNPIDGIHYGQSGFEPYWVSLTQHDGWYRLIHAVGDDGFAYVLLIEVGNSTFDAMCLEFAA